LWRYGIQGIIDHRAKVWVSVRVVVFSPTFNTISIIVVVSFIGGGNRSTRRNLLTCAVTVPEKITIGLNTVF
jgi:hypothetical protein